MHVHLMRHATGMADHAACCTLFCCLYWAVEQLPSMTFAPLLLEPGAPVWGTRAFKHAQLAPCLG